MEATTMARQVEETINGSFLAWSREVVKNADGSLTLSPDFLPKFFKAHANNLAMAYADRVLPDCTWNVDSPTEAMLQAVQCFAMVAELDAIADDAQLEGVRRCRENLAEMLLIIAKQARPELGALLVVVSENIGFIDTLVAKYHTTKAA
jgi:hypothetical protein